jgi:hypothetical protein
MIFEEGTGGYMGPSACAPGAGADACDRWKAENPDKEIDRNTGKTKDKSFDDMAGRGPLAPQETDDKKPAGSGISDIPGMPSKEKSSSPGSGVLKPEAKEKPDK